MTIHKSAAPLSSALERRRCHVLSPQKGAAIDCGGYEREISRDSTPGPVSGHMQEDGGGSIWLTIGATGGQESGSGACGGSTAADTFSHGSL